MYTSWPISSSVLTLFFTRETLRWAVLLVDDGKPVNQQTVLLAGVAVIPVALAQSLDAGAILQALQGAGLNSLSQALASINSTQIALLSGQSVTVLAPTDQAFSNAQSRLNGATPDAVAEVIAYHVLPGNFTSPTTPNALLSSNTVTIARTALNAPDVAGLEGGKAQVLAWTLQGSTVNFINQNTTTTVQNLTQVSSITLAVIDQVLSIPPQISAVFNANPHFFSGIAPVFTGTHVGNNQALIDVLQSQKGLTIFVPNNDAVTANSAALQQLTQNTDPTQLLNVLGNHVINGTSVYSSQITNGAKLSSSRGEDLLFTANTTGVFVTSGTVTAQIVQTDLLTENGVLHVINGVLANVNSDDQKAADAFNSATSAAGVPVTETAPLSAPAAATGASTGGSTTGDGAAGVGGSGNGSGNNNSATGLRTRTRLGLVMGVIVGVFSGGRGVLL
ncbi:hypothetical protein D9758_008928 [Tetrapyrgos nigripes]|uniref:FAS1 domain-containing protein n=1 Tax=Tetrapyrgos nigripes TaxID=182062 RepID=A0A8H5GKF1_9AGAR|nr:hypothetical protein D9758_008928 [Tetrapyrgos nigripes]